MPKAPFLLTGDVSPLIAKIRPKQDLGQFVEKKRLIEGVKRRIEG